jgi:large subunit ribosomal protein L4
MNTPTVYFLEQVDGEHRHQNGETVDYAQYYQFVLDGHDTKISEEKKQEKLALEFALNEKAANNALFVVDSLSVESGKTKDAAKIIKTLGTRDALIVKELVDEKTLLAFRNIQNCYLVEANELNAYLATAFYAVIIEKSVLETITKEG